MFDREARFIERVLAPLAERWPGLRIVFEHVTTRAAVDFVRGARRGVAATVTPQHLLHNRNALFAGGLRPHLYCLPVLKTEADRRSLLEALAGGDARFFLGTDSAPHARTRQGVRLRLRRHLLGPRRHRAVRRDLRGRGHPAAAAGFCLRVRRRFLPPAAQPGAITLVREPWTPPASYPFGDGELVPLRAGERIAWRLQGAGA